MNVQDTVLDLNTMEEVTLVKPVPEFKPVTSTHDALARLGNDTARFLKVINEGLESEEKSAIRKDSSIPWMVEDEDGTLSQFAGVPADMGKFKALRLTLAKTIFGYPTIGRDATESLKAVAKVAKDKAKSDAADMIKNTPAIVEKLKEAATA